jgi:hypothetical protein
MHAVPPGRICGYKHVRRTRRAVKKHCLHAARPLATHIPKTSAGGFLADVPITDRPRQPLGSHEGPLSHFAVPNVWHRKEDCGRGG